MLPCWAPAYAIPAHTGGSSLGIIKQRGKWLGRQPAGVRAGSNVGQREEIRGSTGLPGPRTRPGGEQSHVPRYLWLTDHTWCQTGPSKLVNEGQRYTRSRPHLRASRAKGKPLRESFQECPQIISFWRSCGTCWWREKAESNRLRFGGYLLIC